MGNECHEFKAHFHPNLIQQLASVKGLRAEEPGILGDFPVICHQNQR
jgi:hypothetical protein